jgi:3-keto-disaccharide hydrolase
MSTPLNGADRVFFRPLLRCQAGRFCYPGDFMKRIFLPLPFACLACAILVSNSPAADSGEIPPPKDEPRVVDPGPPPRDAIVLFDGSDLSQWKSQKDGGPVKWELKDGVATVNGTGSIATKQGFGDCQLHIEWASPEKVKGDGQGRGNSGIYFQGRYELQVLDSYENKTYYHGQAGSIYKQYAPLVNVSRKPGEWQVYDVIYHGPRFDDNGKLLKPADITVLQNGVLVQDHVEIKGNTGPSGAPKYQAHPLKQPLTLQDHGNPVRFRNIWIREL